MVAGFALLIFGIVAIFWKDPIVHLIYSCIAALLFSIYLVYDTQLVLGKGDRSFSLDDAYLAAIQLYLDIIQIFLNLLQIIGYVDN
jgi:protein lifeguard